MCLHDARLYKEKHVESQVCESQTCNYVKKTSACSIVAATPTQSIQRYQSELEPGLVHDQSQNILKLEMKRSAINVPTDCWGQKNVGDSSSSSSGSSDDLEGSASVTNPDGVILG